MVAQVHGAGGATDRRRAGVPEYGAALVQLHRPAHRQCVPARAGGHWCQVVVVVGSLRVSWEQQRRRPTATATGRRLAFLRRGERDGDPPACLCARQRQ
jgi:hypothetical protein